MNTAAEIENYRPLKVTHSPNLIVFENHFIFCDNLCAFLYKFTNFGDNFINAFPTSSNICFALFILSDFMIDSIYFKAKRLIILILKKIHNKGHKFSFLNTRS